MSSNLRVAKRGEWYRVERRRRFLWWTWWGPAESGEFQNRQIVENRLEDLRQKEQYWADRWRPAE